MGEVMKKRKPMNVITVYGASNGAGPISYLDCSMMIDAADYSVRIERKSETVAHYSRDEYTKIVQEIG